MKHLEITSKREPGKQACPGTKWSDLCKRFLLSFALLFASIIMYAQTEITGTVIDETGEPVIGATVMETGTQNGVVDRKSVV